MADHTNKSAFLVDQFLHHHSKLHYVCLLAFGSSVCRSVESNYLQAGVDQHGNHRAELTGAPSPPMNQHHFWTDRSPTITLYSLVVHRQLKFLCSRIDLFLPFSSPVKGERDHRVCKKI